MSRTPAVFDVYLACVTLRRVRQRHWPELWLRQRWKHVSEALMAFVLVQLGVATSMKDLLAKVSIIKPRNANVIMDGMVCLSSSQVSRRDAR